MPARVRPWFTSDSGSICLLKEDTRCRKRKIGCRKKDNDWHICVDNSREDNGPESNGSLDEEVFDASEGGVHGSSNKLVSKDPSKAPSSAGHIDHV